MTTTGSVATLSAMHCRSSTRSTVSKRLIAVGQISRANVGGRRYLTFAGLAAERPVYLTTCRTATNRRQSGLGSSGRVGQRPLRRPRLVTADPLLTLVVTKQSSGPQRLLTVAAGGRIHADRHRAVVGPGEWRWLEWRLYEVLRL